MGKNNDGSAQSAQIVVVGIRYLENQISEISIQPKNIPNDASCEQF
jgi:hypothetical protein